MKNTTEIQNPKGLNMFESISEKEQLRLFRPAYERVTGQLLRRVRKSERPDYICERPDGSLVGVELTLITRDPETCLWDEIMNNNRFMDGSDGLDTVCSRIARKGRKRSEKDWQLPDSSILVLFTPDCPICELDQHLSLDPELQTELMEVCEQSGFQEIWIVDYTESEEYGTVELFGLYPKKYWGFHEGPLRSKAYH